FSLCGPILQPTRRRATASSTSRTTATACATRSSAPQGFALPPVLSRPAAKWPSALAASALACTGPSQVWTPSLRYAVASLAVASRTSGNGTRPLGPRNPMMGRGRLDLRPPATYVDLPPPPWRPQVEPPPYLTILTCARSGCYRLVELLSPAALGSYRSRRKSRTATLTRSGMRSANASREISGVFR